jgi:hypothetical protein
MITTSLHADVLAEDGPSPLPLSVVELVTATSAGQSKNFNTSEQELQLLRTRRVGAGCIPTLTFQPVSGGT